MAVSISVCGWASAKPLPLNSGFEKDSPAWRLFVPDSSANAGVTFDIVGDQAQSGNRAVRLSSSETARYGLNGPRVNVVPGEKYRITMWVKADGEAQVRSGHPGVTLRLTLRSSDGKDIPAGHFYMNADGQLALGGAPAKSRLRKLPEEWTKAEAVIEIPQGVSYFNINPFVWGMNGTVYLDDIEVEPVPASTPSSPLAGNPSGKVSTRNLPEISSERVVEIAQWVGEQPAFFCPTFDDRSYWEAVKTLPGAEALLQRARRFAAEPTPKLTEELHSEFRRTGLRKGFEDPFNDRAIRLEAFVMAEGILNDGSFMPLIEQELDAILAEPSWAVPSHTRNRKSWADARDYVDIAAASRAWTLASAEWLLGDRLGAQRRAQIRREVNERVLQPWLERMRTGDRRDFWWMTADHNWNAVCNGAILGAALLVLDSPAERAEAIATYEALYPSFIAGFAADGFCHEGIGYWGYGFGHHAMASQAIALATGGKIDLLESSHIENIAAFAHNWQIVPGLYPAFGDAAVRARPPVWINDFVALRFGVGAMGEFPLLNHRRTLGGQMYATLFGLSSFAQPPTEDEAVFTFSPALLGERDGGAAFPSHSWFPDGAALVSRH